MALLCASIATLATFHGRTNTRRTLAVASAADQSRAAQATLANASVSVPELHPVARTSYPYSVIPGGVRNAYELKSAVFHDSVVAGHYADFNLAKAHVVRLDRDRAVYVSYRLNNRIYWTKKTLKLLKGETLITDGVHEARARCGNRVSDTPAEPVSPEEPPAKVMATPTEPVLVAENVPPVSPVVPPSSPSSPPEAPPGGGIIPPPVVPIVGGGPVSPHHPKTPPPTPPPGTPPPGTPPPVTPPVSTPEPGTWALLALGLFALMAAGRLRWMIKKWKV